MNATQAQRLYFLGLTASPFQLKMEALADAVGVPWRRLPDQGGPVRGIAAALRLRRARRAGRIERFPARVAGLDEYPAVPYYWFDDGRIYYDSTGLGLQLESLGGGSGQLLPADPAARFVCHLIDEAFDEFGLYMAHHNRWVTSARTNRMGDNSAREMLGPLAPGFARQRLARRLAMRQVRRCPYLFSVAPPAYEAGMEPALTPPARDGFPSTHALLDDAWRQYLSAMEAVLTRQPYLLGDRFTLADASAYGQLNMHWMDGRAEELIKSLAPTTHTWLQRIARGEHRGSNGEIRLVGELSDLIRVISRTFIPLMVQNDAAYRDYRAQGQSLFNEAAFDRGEALYDGELMGYPFRSVVKTFQVSCWWELCQQWRLLDSPVQRELGQRFPQLAVEAFEGSPDSSGAPPA